MAAPVYASDPGAAPDSEFEPGELRHLVVGNRGRLLDPRRTPIVVTATLPNTGEFEVRIEAFEDAGARWRLPLDDVARFQFDRGGRSGEGDAVAELASAAARFGGELTVECDCAERERTLSRIAHERASLRERLDHVRPDPVRHVDAREGDPGLYALVEELMAERDLDDLERRFSTTFVSNPASGEFIKGHAIVLAELGLCPFRGKVVRDQALFEGAGTKKRRAEHIVVRMAFVHELFRNETLVLYRGAAVDGLLPAAAPASFTSATFSRRVADEHFAGGPSTRTAVMWRQRVPAGRLFMTFLETREMSRRFKEAEAVLIGDPENRAF